MLANRQLTDEEIRALRRAEETRRIANQEFEDRSALVRRGNDGQLISTAPEDARGRERHIQRLEKERDTQRALHEHAIERSRVQHAQAVARDRERHVERNRQVLERDLGRVAGLSRLEHSADFHREVERFERDTGRELDRYSRECGDSYSHDYLESRERYLRAVDDEKNRLLARDYAANEEDKVRLADRTIDDSERKRIFQAKQSRETAIDRLKNEAERAREADKLAADRLAAISVKERSEPVVDRKFLDQATRLDIQLRFEQADRTYHLQEKQAWLASRTSQYREQHEARAYQAFNDRLAEQQRLVEFDRDLNSQWRDTALEREQQYGDELKRRRSEENRLVSERSVQLQREAERHREAERNRPSALDLWGQELEAKERARSRNVADRQTGQQPEKDKRAGREDRRVAREPERGDVRHPERLAKPPEPKPIQDYVHKLERDRVVYSKASEPEKQAFADYGRRIAVLDRHDELNRRAALTLASERFTGTISIRGSEDYKRSMAETAHQMGMQDRIPGLRDYFKQLDTQKQERERAAAQARDKSAGQAKQPEKAQGREPSRDEARAPEQRPSEPDRKAPEKTAAPEKAPARADQAPERAVAAEPVRQNGTQEPARAKPAKDWRALSHSDHLQQHVQNEAQLQRDVANAQQLAHEPRPVREDEPKVAPVAAREPERASEELQASLAAASTVPAPEQTQSRDGDQQRDAAQVVQPAVSLPEQSREEAPVQPVAATPARITEQEPSWGYSDGDKARQAEPEAAQAAEPPAGLIKQADGQERTTEPVAAVVPSREAEKPYDWGPGARDSSDAELDKLAREPAHQADLGRVQASNEPALSASQEPSQVSEPGLTQVPQPDADPELGHGGPEPEPMQAQAHAPEPMQAAPAPEVDLDQAEPGVPAASIASSQGQERDADAEATPGSAQAEPERDVEPEAQASVSAPTPAHDPEEDYWAGLAGSMESSNNAGRDHERDHDLDQEQGLQR
ncbi:LPD7 domain-containing protein [Roseateles sp. BYS78W]|uniref:LPD7 domain-containing protein n=1 Tax=Pelomonas candidula TaxID=3299025 RepID=A0ABW7HE99_9BURK